MKDEHAKAIAEADTLGGLLRDALAQVSDLRAQLATRAVTSPAPPIGHQHAVALTAGTIPSDRLPSAASYMDTPGKPPPTTLKKGEKWCRVCGKPFTPTLHTRVRCVPCAVADKAPVKQARKPADDDDNEPIKGREDWPSLKIKGFACASCKYGKANAASETKWECKASRAMRCVPHGPAWNYEAQS